MARIFRSIRARIILWYSLVLLATLVAFGLIAFMYSGERLSQSLDRSLKTEVVWVKNFIEGKSSKVRASRKYGAQVSVVPAGDTTIARAQVADTGSGDEAIWNEIYAHAVANPKKTLVEVTNKWGAIPFRSFGTSEESLMVRAEALIGTDIPIDSIVIKTLHDPKGMDLRVAGTKTREIEIYVAYPLAEISEALGNLFSIFLILIPAAMALSVGGGWFLAYKSLKPVDMVTKTAHAITVNNLKQQIPARDVDDEIGRLISTFNSMISRLSESFDQIREFSIAASHELRTPLTIMRGEVEIALRKEKDPAEYRRVLVSNLEEIVRLSSIVESLSTMSKADFEQQEVQYEEVRMKDLLEELYEDSEIIAQKKEIGVELRRNEDVTIIGDRIRLRQLFLNLIDNAIKYTPEHGRVSVSSERRDGFVKVQVQDTGVGIPEAELAKIFDRFYRVDKARSREMGGSGLGLAIAKWVAELHRGHIEVASELGKGSTFTVFLPL
ncbi:MAG TPA: ATP-binding protein [Bacteroidota bacterium]|nr:ATP-binding protein [Bacteroidota bacterium]